MSRPILSIEKLSKRYGDGPDAVTALNNVSLELFEGEIFGLLGVNGAGKTTLSSILATLHPPTSGDVLYRGASIYKELATYRRALGFCPQRQNLDTALTVKQNLVFAGRYFLMPEREIADRVEQLMEQLELTRYANFDVDQLSGGNRQRLLIARALMHKPRVVILDEPTVGLDPDIRQKLWHQIRDLKKESITIILTTHYLDEAEELADRVCVLHLGKIQLLTSMKELKEQHQQEKLEKIFLRLLAEYRREEA